MKKEHFNKKSILHFLKNFITDQAKTCNLHTVQKCQIKIFEKSEI